MVDTTWADSVFTEENLIVGREAPSAIASMKSFLLVLTCLGGISLTVWPNSSEDNSYRKDVDYQYMIWFPLQRYFNDVHLHSYYGKLLELCNLVIKMARILS